MRVSFKNLQQKGSDQEKWDGTLICLIDYNNQFKYKYFITTKFYRKNYSKIGSSSCLNVLRALIVHFNLRTLRNRPSRYSCSRIPFLGGLRHYIRPSTPGRGEPTGVRWRGWERYPARVRDPSQAEARGLGRLWQRLRQELQGKHWELGRTGMIPVTTELR